MNNYRYKQLAYREWKTLYREGKLNETQSAFIKPRAPEMLFDVEKDPYETQNLAQDPEMGTTIKQMHNLLNTLAALKCVHNGLENAGGGLPSPFLTPFLPPFFRYFFRLKAIAGDFRHLILSC